MHHADFMRSSSDAPEEARRVNAPVRISPLGKALAFIVPFVVLAGTWVVVSLFVMLAANGVMRRVDELTFGYIVGSVGLGVVCAAASCMGALALAKAGRMPLWGAVLVTTSLAVLAEFIGSCGVFMVVGTALDIF